MGTARQAAEAVTSALQSQDWGTARQWVADDFVFSDPNSPMPPMGPDEWLGMNRIFFNAFSDFTYNFEILDEEGDEVTVANQLEGTHDGDLDLTPIGMDVIPATGKHVTAARTVTVGSINADGKITNIEIITNDPNGGLPGLLSGLGIDLG